MKKLILFFLTVILTCSCSKDESEIIEASNFEIYKQGNQDFGKVFSGTENEFDYIGYGNFKFIDNNSIYIPKDIKFVEQKNTITNESLIIKLDDNYLPNTFYRKVNNTIVDDIKYHIFYDSKRIIIYHDKLNSNGTYSTIDVTILGGVSQNRISNKSNKISNSDENCDDPFDISDFNICENGNIYEEYGDNFENYTDDTYFSHVGIFVNYLVKNLKRTSCNQNKNSNKSISLKTSNFSCEDFLDNNDIEDICQILQSCETDCTGTIYGSAYQNEANDCIGGDSDNLPTGNGETIPITYYNTSTSCSSDIGTYQVQFYFNGISRAVVNPGQTLTSEISYGNYIQTAYRTDTGEQLGGNVNMNISTNLTTACSWAGCSNGGCN